MKPLLDELTVFIISTGEETMAGCENALKDQDCSFTVKHIKNTFPMSRAFQRMPDECATKYFIQVDSDIILKPHTVKILYEGIKRTSFLTYMAFGQLYEEGFGVGGSVRCWKHSLFKYFKFRDCRTVDRDLYRRVRRIGLRGKNLNQVLGLHIARHSPFSNYLKTKSDIEKWRFLKRPPEKYALSVLNRSIENLPSTCNELFGALLGTLTVKDRLVRSKNIQLETERYNELLRYLGINGHELKINALTLDRDKINSFFCKSYDDIAHRDINTKKRLADFIIETFSTGSAADSEELLKIAAR